MLTYIGCRWLAATQSFGDLILNALALEFAPRRLRFAPSFLDGMGCSDHKNWWASKYTPEN